LKWNSSAVCLGTWRGRTHTRVNINKTVVSSSERLLKVSGVNILVRTFVRVGSTGLFGSLVPVGVTNVVSKPGILATVVGSLIGLPGILSASGEAGGLEAHILEGDGAGEDYEVGP
jgi:hypothetical protein